MSRNLRQYLKPNCFPVQRVGKDQQIQTILEQTNFERIHTAMQALNWRWANCPTDIPTIEYMKQYAQHILERVWDSPEDENYQIYESGSGGFMAYKFVVNGYRMLSLKFVLSGWDFDILDVQSENYF